MPCLQIHHFWEEEQNESETASTPSRSVVYNLDPLRREEGSDLLRETKIFGTGIGLKTSDKCFFYDAFAKTRVLKKYMRSCKKQITEINI